MRENLLVQERILKKKKILFPIFKEIEAISKNGGQTTKATF